MLCGGQHILSLANPHCISVAVGIVVAIAIVEMYGETIAIFPFRFIFPS